MEVSTSLPADTKQAELADAGVTAPDSPQASQPNGSHGSATTSIPGSPTEESAAVGSSAGAFTARADVDAASPDGATASSPAAFTNGRFADGLTAAASVGDDAQSDYGSGSDFMPTEDELAQLNALSGSNGHSEGFRGDHLTAAEPDDAQAQLKQALERIAQLEDQNDALWQELQNDVSGGEHSSEGGSPTVDDADKKGGASMLQDGKMRISSRFQEAFDAKEEELAFLRQRCMQFEVEVEQEFEELNEQLFKAQQKVHGLQQNLSESEAKRRQTESAKLMVEGKLQETMQQLVECEKLLVHASARAEKVELVPKDVTNGPSPAPAESPGTPPGNSRSGHPFFNSLLEHEVEQLKEENEALMGELVLKKMALAELSESYAKVKRDLHRREAKDRAVSSKMNRLHAILGAGANGGFRRTISNVSRMA